MALDWESRWGLWRGAGDSDRRPGSIMRSPGVEPGGGNGLVRIRHCAGQPLPGPAGLEMDFGRSPDPSRGHSAGWPGTMA